MKSKDLRQLDLPVMKPVEHVARPQIVDAISLLPTIRNIRTLHGSIEFARELSGLEDKEIYDRVGIDSGAFSRMKAGSAWYPQDERWLTILNTMHTEIPVIWQVEALGYDWSSLRKHQTDLEARLEQAEKRVRELEHEREVERRCLHDILGGRR